MFASKKKKWLYVIVLILCSLRLAMANTTLLERQKLLAADGTAADGFGISVSISKDLAIVGAYYGDGNVTNSGSAYIFKWDGTNWTQQQKLLATDGAAGDYFGWAVSISGDFAIVSAHRDDDNGDSSGSAYIFAPNDVDPNKWDQKQKLLASDGAALDTFGARVHISGDLAIVGANRNDDNGYESGSVYIFKRDGTSWSQQQKLLASDGEAGDFFGASVFISDEYSIVGADGDDDNGIDSGSVYIFTPNDVDPNNWIQRQKLLASDGAAGDNFGGSVFVNGDLAIVGADGGEGNTNIPGWAYIFAPNDVDPNNWVQQQKLMASDGTDGDLFGWSVSISSDLAIVGAYYDDDNGGNSGSAYIFTPNDFDPNNWVQQQKLLASDGTSGDWFGRSVSISGDFAILGAYGDDDNGSGSGSAYIFQAVECANWLTADLNNDCFVDFFDFGIFAVQWLKCGDPYDPNCQP